MDSIQPSSDEFKTMLYVEDFNESGADNLVSRNSRINFDRKNLMSQQVPTESTIDDQIPFIKSTFLQTTALVGERQFPRCMVN
jgi:hypothetical protein